MNKSEGIEGEDEDEGVEDKGRDVAGRSVSSEGKDVAGKGVSSEGKDFRVRVLRRRVIFLRVIYYLFVALDKFYLLEKKF